LKLRSKLMATGIPRRFMQCLKLLILAPVQMWTPLRIPKWFLLLSVYEGLSFVTW